jgi:hypothetical protein
MSFQAMPQRLPCDLSLHVVAMLNAYEQNCADNVSTRYHRLPPARMVLALVDHLSVCIMQNAILVHLLFTFAMSHISCVRKSQGAPLRFGKFPVRGDDGDAQAALSFPLYRGCGELRPRDNLHARLGNGSTVQKVQGATLDHINI